MAAAVLGRWGPGNPDPLHGAASCIQAGAEVIAKSKEKPKTKHAVAREPASRVNTIR